LIFIDIKKAEGDGLACFQDLINNLWSNIIEDMDIDVMNNSIRFKTLSIDKGISSKHEIRFEKVSSFFFVRDSGEQRFNFYPQEEGDYLELTAIDYYPEGIGHIAVRPETENWTKQYFSNANFSIEIWSSFLFIEAGRIVIDGNIFEEKPF